MPRSAAALCRTRHADIRAACKVRAQAYGHHLPQAQQQFAQPDAQDRHRATAIIVCRDKQSGDATGTLRIQRSSHGPLQLENSMILPRWLAERFDGLDSDLATRKLIAAAVAAEQVLDLVDRGVTEFHFYTMNRADLVYAICHLLGLRPQAKEAA